MIRNKFIVYVTSSKIATVCYTFANLKRENSLKKLSAKFGALTIVFAFIFSVGSASAQGMLTLSNTVQIPGVSTDDTITDAHLHRLYSSTATDIRTWSISDPQHPTLIAITPAYGFWVQKMLTKGNFLYAVAGNNLDIYKIQDSSTQPLILWSHIQTIGTQPDYVSVAGDYAYVADWSSTALLPKVEIFNVSKKTAPVLAGTLGQNSDTLRSPASATINGNYLYVTSDYNSTLNIYDITNPATPIPAASVTLNGAVETAFNGSYAYVTGINSNVVNVVDIANPTQPVLAGTVALPQFNQYADDPSSIVIRNNEMYLNTINFYNFKLLSYNLSNNPIQPSLDQTFSTNNWDPVGLAIIGKTLYQAINGPSGPSQSAINVYSIAR